MREINPDYIRDLVELANKAPYLQLLSMKICELNYGYCLLEVNLDSKHLNPFGGLHGGAYASIIDTAAYWALVCGVNEDSGLISLDLT